MRFLASCRQAGARNKLHNLIEIATLGYTSLAMTEKRVVLEKLNCYNPSDKAINDLLQLSSKNSV